MLRQTRQLLMERWPGSLSNGSRMEIRVLSREEALGRPEGEEDFPLSRGKEHLIEATFEGAAGQVFTPQPSTWSGTLMEWLQLDPETPESRPLVLAGINALTRRLAVVSGGTRHCRDGGPTRCARAIGELLMERLGAHGVLLLIGLQPAILEAAVAALGTGRIRVLDLQTSHIGRLIKGVRIGDGERDLGTALEGAALALVTGSSMANGTFEQVRRELAERNIPMVLYGTTGAGPAAILGLERWCFEAE